MIVNRGNLQPHVADGQWVASRSRHAFADLVARVEGVRGR